MSVKHLSEKEIQQYLDDKSKGLDNPQPGHIDECEQCRSMLADYQKIYYQLGKEEKRLLSADFASRTMAKIRRLEKPAFAVNQYMIWFGICGIVSCLAAIWYFVDVKALLQAVTSFSSSQSLATWSFIGQMKELTVKLGDNLGILIFAGLLLVAVALADKLLIKEKPTEAHFVSI